MRADVNVSVRKPGGPLGTRCEIKNVNSIRFIMQAIEYEARRQIEMIEDGGTIRQETRLFDSRKRRDAARCAPRKRRTTTAISPIPTCCRWSSNRPGSTRSRASLPELPDAKKARFIASPACRPTTPACWSPSRKPPTISRRWWRRAPNAKAAANWLINEYFGRLNKAGLDDRDGPGSRRLRTARSCRWFRPRRISGKIAKDVLDIVWSEGGDPRAHRRGARAAPGDRHRRDRDAPSMR